MGRIVDESFFDDSEAVADDSLGYKAVGSLAKLGQGMTANFSDEIAGAVKSLPGYLGLLSAGNPENLSLADVYRQEKNLTNKALNQFTEEHPILGTGSEILGSIASPISKIKAGGVLGSAALQSGIMGAGAADTLAEIPEQAIESGVIGAGTAGALGLAGKGLKAIGGKASSMAEATKNKLLGLQYSDIKKSLEKGANSKEGVSAVEDSINRLVDKGILKPGEARANYDIVDDILTKNRTAVKDKLILADQVQEELIQPDFKNTLKYLENETVDAEQLRGLEIFKKYASPLLKNRGMISEMEHQKSLFGKLGADALGREGSDQLEANIHKYMALDIKNAVNDELKKPLYKAKLGKNIYEEVQDARKEMQDLLTVYPALTKANAREKVSDADSLMTGLLRTTGGYGVPVLVGAGIGEGTGAGALAGAGAGLALRSTAGRKALIPTLKGIGGAAKVTGDVASKSALPAARLSNLFSEEEPKAKKSESKSSKKSAKIVDASFFDEEPVQQISFDTALETPEGRDLILDALRQVESGGNPNAVSPAGAMGAYQFMPETAKAYNIDPFDEAASRVAAEKYLLDEYSALGDIRSALGAYNAGRPRISKARENAGSLDFADYAQFLPLETQEYSPKVEMAFNELLKARS